MKTVSVPESVARRSGARWLALTTWILLLTCQVGAASSEVAPWRLGVAAWSFNRFTLEQAIKKAAALGVPNLEAFEGQRILDDVDIKLTVELSGFFQRLLEQKLAAAHVTLTSIYIHNLPADREACRRYFELARSLGVEFIVSEPAPEALPVVDELCAEFDLRVAIHNHPEGSSRYWHPREVLKALEGRSARMGACGDVGHWVRSGLKPVEAIGMLGSRLISLHVKDLHEAGPKGHDVPWGTGQSDIGGLLSEVARLGLKPRLFTIEYEHNWENSFVEIGACAAFFDRTTRAWREPAAGEAKPGTPVDAGELYAGWASVDITPTRPVALVGQLHKRISKGVLDPLTATALALETTNRTGALDQAILVSCDVIWTQKAIQDRVRAAVKDQVPGFNTDKLCLNATHTHTAPGMVEATFRGLYDVSGDPGVMNADEYGAFFVERVAQAVVAAWQSRRPAGFTWGMDYAVVGSNRRVQYFNGFSVMYGQTATNQFARLEGSEDHAVDVLCLWTPTRVLSGLVINLACPAQETEGLEQISADFWHDIRTLVRQRHGQDLFVLPQCAIAGDQSPHPVWRKEPERIMAERYALSRRQAIAGRVANAIDLVLAGARDLMETNLVLRHTVARVDLPVQTGVEAPFYDTDPARGAEFHVLRLGDVAIATNPFELFLDYGLRIEARSPAKLTLTVQLACQHGGYLPTAEAVRGGGYSADRFVVGPEGGQVLVNETVSRLEELWR